MSASNTVSNKKIFGATMLVTGCCIGAGMIGLPILSSLTGLMPSVVAMIFCYAFTTISGLLLVEATLWFEGRVNLPSIVEFSLGRMGKIATILLFLFLFYCLFVAYLDGGGGLFSEMISYVLRTDVSHSVGVVTCMLFIAAIAYAGAKSADGVNRFMVAAMVISYLMLVGFAIPNIKPSSLVYTNWSAMFGVVPILLLCFGYQNLVPSLSYYLEKNASAIRKSIIIGNFIPFIVYFIWDFVILGMLPGQPVKTADETQLVAGLLSHSANPAVSVIFFIKSFSLFAMLTSFLPCALSFVDFLKDGISKMLHQKVRNDFFIFLLVFIPPTVCALIYPSIFLHALGFAGGFIDVLLFGVLPALVVLVGRRLQPAGARYQVAGGMITPIVVLILSIVLLAMKFTLT